MVCVLFWHQSFNGNVMGALGLLFVFVYLGTRIFFSEIGKGSFYLPSLSRLWQSVNKFYETVLEIKKYLIRNEI